MKWMVKCFLMGLLSWTAAAQASDSPSDLLAAGRVDDVITTVSGQINSAPNDAASYNFLCRAYFAVSNWDRAISACYLAKAWDRLGDEKQAAYWMELAGRA